MSLDDYEAAHGEDVPRLKKGDLSRGRPIEDFPGLAQALERGRGQRGPQRAPVKERVGLRLDRDVIEFFRGTGPGWQTRINDVLTKHVKQERD